MDMDKNEIFKAALVKATEQSLAEWGFIDIKRDDSVQSDVNGEAITIKLAIEHPLTGEMFFSYASSMARRIADNLFQGEMLVNPAILKDIMGESSNIILGRCFQLFTPKEKIVFGIPEVGCMLPSADTSYQHISFLTYENERVTLLYRLKAAETKR